MLRRLAAAGDLERAVEGGFGVQRIDVEAEELHSASECRRRHGRPASWTIASRPDQASRIHPR